MPTKELNLKKLAAIKVAKNISRLREEKRISQSELASELAKRTRFKRTEELVNLYESAEMAPNLLPLIALSDIFEVSIDELVGRRA